MITLQKAKEDILYNPIKLDMYFHLHLVYMYSNLSFTEKQKEDEEKIYDAVVSGRYISLDSDEKIVTVENSSGQTLDFSAIKKGQLLTVYDSETYTRVIINSDSVSAKIYATFSG